MSSTVTHHRPPPLSNYSKWFDFYDSDHSATIDRVELTSALIETTGALSTSDINSIRDTVNFVFEIFDSDGSNSIDRNEFCVSGGLGESLLAAICQMGNGESRWQCKSCQFYNFQGADCCAVCGGIGPSSSSSSSSTGQWACERCSYENAPNCDTCEMCAGSRPAPRTEPTPPPRQSRPECTWESPWACERCSYENKPDNNRCEMCDGDKPVSRPPESTPSREARKPPRSNRSSRSSQGSASSGASSDSQRRTLTKPSFKIEPWQCNGCSFNNTQMKDVCEICREDRASTNNIEREPSPPPESAPRNSLAGSRRPPSIRHLNVSWNCETCNFTNKPDKSECVMCRGKALAAMIPTGPGNGENKGKPSRRSSGIRPSRRSSATTKIKIPWECPECLFMCGAETRECEMCRAPRPEPATRTERRSPTRNRTRGKKLRTVRACVPHNGYPGQNVKVKVGDVIHKVVVPDRSKWCYTSNDAAPEFEATVCVDGDEQGPCQSSRSPTRSNNKGGGGTEDWIGFKSSSRPTPPPLVVTRVPICLAPIHVSGRRRSLIIGINYENTRAQLEGCINDAKNVKTMLARNGYPTDTSHMVMLTDDNKYDNGRYLPTGKNIVKAMRWLVHGASPGDIMFLHFSGHGAQVPDKTGQESDGLNETILPMDYKKQVIVDDEMWGTLVQPLPSGAKLIAVMDCCHSGTGLDLPFEYKRSGRKGGKWIEEINPAHSCGDVVLFSGCKDDQQSADVQDTKKGSGGAMTYAFRKALEKYPKGTTYTTFMDAVQKCLKKHGMKNQRPQLTSSQKFDVDKKIFSLTDGIVPNSNEKVGRLMRRRIKPGKVVNDLPIETDIDEFLFGDMRFPV